MTEATLIYTGKAKQLLTTDDPAVLKVVYLDQATALNGKKKVAIRGKGPVNCEISTLLFKTVAAAGIPTHYVATPNDHTMLVKKCTMIPLEVVFRNFASGHFESKFQIDHLRPLTPAVHEYYFKSDTLNDPFINNDQIQALNIADAGTLNELQIYTDQLNAILTARFAAADIQLVDGKFEFGRLPSGELVLADELSPDNFRLVDIQTKESLDKDIFRKDEGPLVPVYEEVLRRLQESEA
ncbi:phosphoribosylaminoimidazolesuccinocarboxamide synthase [Schleiferilactobacillus perolens]|jgi:phosphoribosylaminoimidazole-succinocarboxamide synthase|uniref:phosphoribosylaminoimidazolesuccinocarboxamide synthase n=1 Tax=Schleiferilactobacillus perolens TaxID=100468 RepID=UPI00235417D8|nr:phosphoribosylaminoimidazolesuccinocarboxamide synthase [Schleiferilactobacillus perolens]MCI2172432.1 phosphoribosylaminoimidazolesuccinocarboxamide synthase [Schleiferilactobacillus perolens]